MFPSNHAFDLMLRAFNGDGCARACAARYMHPCGTTNGALYAALMRAALRTEPLGRGVHGVVYPLERTPALERRLGCSNAVLKVCAAPIRNLQNALNRLDVDVDANVPQFVAEMIHAGLFAALVFSGATQHLLRSGPFVTSGDMACYAMERADGDLITAGKGLLRSAADAHAVLLGVLHTLMVLQETYAVTQNDLKPTNVFFVRVPPAATVNGVDVESAAASAEWWGYELDANGSVAWIPAPAFVIKLADPGVAVSHHIRLAGVRRPLCPRTSGIPLGPAELVRNRMPTVDPPAPGTWVRIVRNGKTLTDGIVRTCAPEEHTIFLGCGSGNILDGAPRDEVATTCVVDTREAEVLHLNPAYEMYGVHGGYQPGYDMHFFLLHFVPLLHQCGIRPGDVALLSAVLSLHAFPSCENDARVPERVQDTMRPRHDDVFGMSAKQVLAHPRVRAALCGTSPPSGAKTRIVAGAH